MARINGGCLHVAAIARSAVRQSAWVTVYDPLTNPATMPPLDRWALQPVRSVSAWLALPKISGMDARSASPCLTIVGRSAFVYNDIHFRIVTTSLLFVVSLASSGARGGGFLRILRALSTFCATSDPFVTTR